MSFVPDFSFEEFSGIPSNVLGTDLSTGIPGSVVSRRISFLQSDGTYLVPTGASDPKYILWALATNPITISNLLIQDTSVTATVDWLDSGGGVVGSLSKPCLWQEFGNNFYCSLVVSQVPITIPSIQNSTNYWDNLSILQQLLNSSYQAIYRNSDIYASQVCNDAVQDMIINQAKLF